HAYKRRDHSSIVVPGIGAQSGNHSRRNGNKQGKTHGQDNQLDSDWKAAYEIGKDGTVGNDRRTPITGDQVDKPEHVLHIEGTIQAIVLAYGGGRGFSVVVPKQE